MTVDVYSPTTLDHFLNPRHVGQAAGFVGVGRARSRVCDDRLEITVAFEDGQPRIGFRAQACSACIAAASMLASLVNAGLDRDAARAIDTAQLASALGEVPADKLRCVHLAPVAFARALDDAAAQGPAT